MIHSVHFHQQDPGLYWHKDADVAVDSDGPLDSTRTLTPNVVRMDAGYRLYYHGFGPQHPWPQSSGYILSAFSNDAESWHKEQGVRIDAGGEAAADCVWGPDVIPLRDGGYRMYFEGRTNHAEGRVKSVILSARSSDGLDWHQEAGVRLTHAATSYGAPRCLHIEPGSADRPPRFRLYASASPFERSGTAPAPSGGRSNCNIVSAIAEDGLSFTLEPGIRLAQDRDLESYSLYAPEVLRLGAGGYRLYYAGWMAVPELPAGSPYHGRIFSASSADGLAWHKDPGICIDNGGKWDGTKASEPCVIDLPDGRFRMFYEACDHTGRWRIASATSTRR